MAVVWNRQYRPISTSETNTNDPVSVRAIRDLADGINNYRYCVGNFKLIFEIFPYGGLSSRGAYGEGGGEIVVLAMAPIYIPSIYTALVVHIGHYVVTSGENGDPTAWRLRFIDVPYIKKNNVTLLDTSVYANHNMKHCYWETTTTHSIQTEVIEDIHFGGLGRPIYPILTASASLTGLSTPFAAWSEAKITSIDVTPMVGDRI